MSQVISELANSRGAAIRFLHARKSSDDRRLKKLEKNKLQYRKRRATGLCSHGRCPKAAESGHTHCREHLEAMAKHALEKRTERIAKSLCIYCGQRPPFWGRRCVICRQFFAKHPLPYGARRALRNYREAEARGFLEKERQQAQAEARKLLAGGEVCGLPGVTLRLYLGLDDGKCRTYRAIGELVNLSGERVRQLLAPSKILLANILGDKVQWKPVTKPSRVRKKRPYRKRVQQIAESDRKPDFVMNMGLMQKVSDQSSLET